jgi:NADPH-dependent 2,4-dienoyl-CoA reductase/sulfur reductase-like enzyme/CxxC motif-containing protein
MKDFLLIERDIETGGILNQCIHNGFGLEFFREDLTGPEFAEKLAGRLEENILTSAMVSRVTRKPGGGFTVRAHSKSEGLLLLEADTIITATGCRERTRENVEVPGTRPAGIFTAGQAQALINRQHSAIGRRIVTQGSGDIGLIMARRLTIEGFEVAAVLERLSYLSGSIRNKVQCLDHFGIELRLGSQIAGIQGKNRVSSVQVTAVDEVLNFVHGTGQEIKCDAVLFAAGLIPELETVKPAGIELPDNFHPRVNSRFETNVPGLFAAGNCLHINDLADSAAAEGIRTAEAVIEYLADPGGFRRLCRPEAPYTDTQPNRELNADFFKKTADGKFLVCIVCPKGCLLEEGNFGCSRGEEYFRRTAGPAGEYRQRLSTTVELPLREGEILPAVSVEEIPTAVIPRIRALLKKKASEIVGIPQTSRNIIITFGGESYTFILTPVENRGRKQD